MYSVRPDEEESYNHLFFNCEKVGHVWNLLSLSPSNNLQEWTQKMFSSPALITCYGVSLPAKILVPIALWLIWKNRNKNTFEHREEAIDIRYIINITAEFFYLTASRTKSRGKVPIQVKWHPPDYGMYKLNIDGSFNMGTGNGGAGGLIRDHAGNWVCGFMKHIPDSSPLEAEVAALLLGLKLAKDRCIKDLNC